MARNPVAQRGSTKLKKCPKNGFGRDLEMELTGKEATPESSLTVNFTAPRFASNQKDISKVHARRKPAPYKTCTSVICPS
jgi:hypothetical protein